MGGSAESGWVSFLFREGVCPPPPLEEKPGATHWNVERYILDIPAKTFFTHRFINVVATPSLLYKELYCNHVKHTLNCRHMWIGLLVKLLQGRIQPLCFFSLRRVPTKRHNNAAWYLLDDILFYILCTRCYFVEVLNFGCFFISFWCAFYGVSMVRGTKIENTAHTLNSPTWFSSFLFLSFSYKNYQQTCVYRNVDCFMGCNSCLVCKRL